jgi:hypothetical protein
MINESTYRLRAGSGVKIIGSPARSMSFFVIAQITGAKQAFFESMAETTG